MGFPGRWFQMVNAPKEGQKVFLEGEVEALLDEIKAAGRQPDAWERFKIAGALNAILTGWHILAAGEIDLARHPKEGVNWKSLERYSDGLRDLDDAGLRKALAFVRAQPANEFWRPT